MREAIPWVWAVMAMLFGVAEIFTAGFVLACFGIGAGAASLVAFAGYGLGWQLLAFALVSGVTVLLSRRFAQRVSNPSANTVGIDRVIGRSALVLEAIEPKLARGRVRVERETWSADSIDGAPIAQGANVVVIAVEGTRLKVRPI
jgi:membrane protein implicated in regulation of membrane protease activity